MWGRNDPFGADEQDILIAALTPANPETTIYFDVPLPVINNEGTPASLYVGWYTTPAYMTAIRLTFDWVLVPDAAWTEANWADSTPAIP